MQSIGERLEEARKRKGISIREAAEATKIRSDYLHKFESNQFDIKLPEIYVRGFLRTYANYLKSPADKIISDYNALGLSDSKSSRGLNREVYGRMDLSVSSAKTEKDANDTVPPIETTPPMDPTGGTRNPATFVPKPAVGMPIDRALIVKAGVLLATAVIIILVVILLFSNRGEKTAATNPATQTSPDTTWIRPNPGEPVLTLIALDRVTLTVTQTNNGQTLYQGILLRGDRREIPYRSELRLNTEFPENLRVNVGGTTDWPVKDRSSIIKAPSR